MVRKVKNVIEGGISAVFAILQIQLTQQMFYAEDQVPEYFGYNSIMTVQGKHVRRLRRTQLSSQKIATMRSKSPMSRTPSAKKLKLKQSKTSGISAPIIHNRSKLTLKHVNTVQNGFNREKQSMDSDYNQFPIIQSFSTYGSVKTDNYRPGDTSLGNNLIESNVKKSKQRSLSRGQSQKRQNYKPEQQSLRNITDRQPQRVQQMILPPNIPVIPKKKIKKLESVKSLPKDNPLPVLNMDYVPDEEKIMTSSNYEIPQESSKMSLKESIRSKSKSKLRVSKSNSRLNKSSSMTFKQSAVNLKGYQSFSQSDSPFQSSNRKSIMKGEDIEDYYGLRSEEKIESKISIQVAQSNSIGQPFVSHQGQSKNQQFGSSLSSKIRSKIKIRQESKLSQCSIQNKQNSKLSAKHLKSAENVNMNKKQGFGMCQSKVSEKQGGSGIKSRKKGSKMNPERQEIGSGISSKRSSRISQKIESKISKKRLSNLSNRMSSAISQSMESNNSKSNSQASSHRPSIQIVAQPKLPPPPPKKAEEFTLQDVMTNIEEHDIRLGFIYLFVDNTHNVYETPIMFERYERLCFLMVKKYLFEKNRMIKTLKGMDDCFNLSQTEIPFSVIEKFKSSEEIKQKTTSLIEQGKQIFREMEDEYHKLHRKHPKDKLIKLESPKDNFTKEIMKLLMEQLTKVYQQLQREDAEQDSIEINEERVVQIIQIMFLMSELSGRPVKPFELMEDNLVDFDQYYANHYEKIIETTEYFQKLKE